MNNEIEYDQFASQLNNKAKEEYNEWVKTLSPKDLETLRENGGIEFSYDKQKTSGNNPNSTQDIAESNLASYEPDYAKNVDKPHEVLAEMFDIPLDKALKIQQWHDNAVKGASDRYQAFIIQRVVGGLLSTSNPKISAAGLAFATELDAINGIPSQAKFAEDNNISRSTVSKSVLYWQETLELKKGVHQKSEDACKKYAQIGKNSHWRSKKTNAKDVLKKLSKLKKAK